MKMKIDVIEYRPRIQKRTETKICREQEETRRREMKNRKEKKRRFVPLCLNF